MIQKSLFFSINFHKKNTETESPSLLKIDLNPPRFPSQRVFRVITDKRNGWNIDIMGH